MVLCEGDLMTFTSATQQREGKIMVKAPLWRRRSFADVLFHTPLRSSCLWVGLWSTDPGQKDCRFWADPDEMYCPKHRKHSLPFSSV